MLEFSIDQDSTSHENNIRNFLTYQYYNDDDNNFLEIKLINLCHDNHENSSKLTVHLTTKVN